MNGLNRNAYLRFDIPADLGDIDLEEYEMGITIQDLARNYLTTRRCWN
jgi:hypothetical protein